MASNVIPENGFKQDLGNSSSKWAGSSSINISTVNEDSLKIYLDNVDILSINGEHPFIEVTSKDITFRNGEYLYSKENGLIEYPQPDYYLYGMGFSYYSLFNKKGSFDFTKLSNTKWKQVDIGEFTHSTGYFSFAGIDFFGNLYIAGEILHETFNINADLYKITTNVKKAYAGDRCCFYIDNDDYLYSFGCNDDGRLGNGSTLITLTPTQIGNSKWKIINALSDWGRVFGIDENGYLYGWGYQDTLNISSTQMTPYQIGISKWKDVNSSIFQFCSIAIDENGYLYGWGQDNYGLLTGNATYSVYNSPIKMNDTKWKQICGGNHCAYGLTEDGYLYGWGCNDDGQLGIGNTSSSVQYTPLKISDTKWKNISAKFTYFNYAIFQDENEYVYILKSNQYTPLLFGTTKWSSFSSGESMMMIKDPLAE